MRLGYPNQTSWRGVNSRPRSRRYRGSVTEEIADALAQVEDLPLAERAEGYLSMLEQLRRRLEDADAAR